MVTSQLPVSPPSDTDLTPQLDRLADRFAQLGQWLRETVRDMEEAGRPPSSEILRDLDHVRTRFCELRDSVFALAAQEDLPRLPQPEHVISLAELRPLYLQVEEARAWRLKRTQLIRQASVALERIERLVHEEGAPVPGLDACQRQAHELQDQLPTLSDHRSLSLLEDLAEMRHPLCELLMLACCAHDLGDDQWDRLQDRVAQNFGRPLAIAAARGKLVEPA